MARQLGMKRAQETPEAERRKEGVLHGILVCALGGIWLAQEIGTIKTDVPFGPIIIIVIGFLMLLPWLKK
ncbi:MAG: hypothetical protein NTX79_03580 [Candidatus Micrarchaeota archaeon]|nr:hypothetical protein [Candidatus Micrarchaeota archaeon]